MTNPNTPLQQRGAAVQQVAQQLVGEASSLWTEAADQSDSAEGLGIDGRIQLVHGLVDLWVKGNVALLQALLAGPRGGTEAGQSGISTLRASEPLPSEVVVVPAQPYARRLEAKGPFTRVGLDKRTIPRSCIAFTPEVLDANETELQIHLKEFRFVGANYTGTVVLTGEPTAASGPAPDEQVVIVGL